MKYPFNYFKCSVVLLWILLALIPFATNAQNKKSAKAQDEKVVWGLEQINLDSATSEKSEGENALAASFRYLRDKMLPEEQLEFKAWNINLHATESERGIKRNEKKTAKYIKEVEATSRYFVMLIVEWDKEHLIKDLDVQMNLPETVPAFQEFSKKQVTMMAKMMIKESLRSAGLMSAPKPK